MHFYSLAALCLSKAVSIQISLLSLWKDVTYNLKIRDIDAATAAKHALEERQRAEARARKENETPWETRVSFMGAV